MWEPGDYKRDQPSLVSKLCSQEMESESCSLQTKQFYLEKKNVIAVLKINHNLKLTVLSSLVYHNDFIFILSTGICFYCLLSSVKHLIAPLRQLSVLTTLVTV